MIDYSKWPTPLRTVLRLKLDPENIRLSNTKPLTRERQIIEYMIRHEKIMLLVRSIARKGYLPNEAPIVVQEGSNFIVLEGNRRMTACKVLIDPSLAPKDKQSAIKKYRREMDISLIEKLHVLLAPDRESAQVVIHNRHTGRELKERWDSGKQDNFYQRELAKGSTIGQMSILFDEPKSEILGSLIRFNMYQEALKMPLSDEVRAAVTNEEEFPITTFARIWSFSKLRDFLGVAFSRNGVIIRTLPDEEFTKRFVYLIEAVVDGELDSRKINSEEDVAPYLEELGATGLFDLSLKARVPAAEELEPVVIAATGGTATTPQSDEEDSSAPAVEPEEDVVPVPKPKASRALIPSAAICYTGLPKIDGVFHELQTLPVNKHRHAVAVLLRSFLEMVVSQYLSKNGGIDVLTAEELEKHNPEKSGLLNRTVSFFSSTQGIDKNTVHLVGLANAMSIKAELPDHWAPSLRHMLDYLCRSDVKLLKNPKYKTALRTYLNTDKKLSHQDFNDFVHNEYISPTEEALREFWSMLAPLLSFILQDLDSRSTAS